MISYIKLQTRIIWVFVIIALIIFAIGYCSSCSPKTVSRNDYEYVCAQEVILLNPTIECPICGEKIKMPMDRITTYHRCGAKLYRVDNQLLIFKYKDK